VSENFIKPPNPWQSVASAPIPKTKCEDDVPFYLRHGPDKDVHRLSRLSWKWRERSSVKITERTHEKERKHYTAEEKVAILRRHLLEKSRSRSCARNWAAADGVLPLAEGVLRERGRRLPDEGGQPSAEQERIEYLEKKIQTKDEVLAELMAEHIALKKSLGEL
jgi:transposase